MSSSITDDDNFGLYEHLPPYPHPNTSPPTYTSVPFDADARVYPSTSSYDVHCTSLVHPTTIFPHSAEAVRALSVENESELEPGAFTRLNTSTFELYPRSQNIEQDLTRGDVELERAGYEGINASRIPIAPSSIIASVFARGRLRAANRSSTHASNADATWPRPVQHTSTASRPGQQPAETSLSDYWTHRQPPAYNSTPIQPPVEVPQHVVVSTTPRRGTENEGPGCKTYCKFLSLAVSLVLFGIAVLVTERKVKRDPG